MIALIVYGSLYPWRFVARRLPANPLYILLHSWNINWADRRFVSDVIINIAIYLPPGMCSYLAFRRRSRWIKLLAPVALGVLLSAIIEMIQLFTPQRTCSAVDLTNNAIGSGLGLCLGMVFERVVELPRIPGRKSRPRDRSAVALLFCGAASLLFPFFPALWLGIWRAKIAAFLHGPVFSPIPLLLMAAEWFAAGRLLVAARVRSPRAWIALALLILPAQFAILNRFPMPVDFIGAVTGVLLFLWLGKKPGADSVGAFAILSALVLTGLTPFHLTTESQGFSWIPFVGVLNAEWQSGLQILLPKLFQYGAALWLLCRAGMKLLYATSLLTCLLAGIEAAQTRIPGHVAEITDPLLAVLLGIGLRALRL